MINFIVGLLIVIGAIVVGLSSLLLSNHPYLGSISVVVLLQFFGGLFFLFFILWFAGNIIKENINYRKSRQTD